MVFDPQSYGEQVARILALGHNGAHLMPLETGECWSEEGRAALRASNPSDLFPAARSPLGAAAGLWLYFDCFDESHAISQDLHTPEGSYWHAILHRREPDAGNAAYWFHRVGQHPAFDPLADAVRDLQSKEHKHLLALEKGWDPFAFVDLCEEARHKPASDKEHFARRVQLIEWQTLFDWCAKPAR
jgi:hypothetical protein